MTINKLLGAVAAIALLAGAAQAQTVSIDLDGNFDGATVPSELNGPLTGTAILDFALDDVFVAIGAGGVVQASFSLNNATFNGPVPAAAWTQSTSTECNFGTPALGGGAGGTRIAFNSTVDATANDGYITLPIAVTDPSLPVSIDVSFTPTADAGGYAGVASNSVVHKQSRFLTSDIPAGVVANNTFTADGTALDVGASGVLGTIDLGSFPAGAATVTDLGISIVGAPGGAAADAAPTPAAQDIATAGSLAVTFPSGTTGLGGLTLNAVSCGAPVAGVYTCPIAGGGLDAIDGGAAGYAIAITADGNPATAVVPQTPTAVLTVTGAAGYTVAGATGALAPIDLNDGISVTPVTNSNFAWTRIGSGGTESNFRMNFASDAVAAAVTEIRVAVADGNGVSAQTIALTKTTDASTGFRQLGSTLVFNSAALGTVAGGSGNANITSVSLQHDDVTLTPLAAAAATPLRQLVNRAPGTFVATPGLASDN